MLHFSKKRKVQVIIAGSLEPFNWRPNFHQILCYFFVLVGATFLFQCCELKYEVSVWSKLMNEDSRWVAKRGDCLIFKVMFGDLKYSLTLWRLKCKKIKVNKWKLLLEAKSCKEMNQLGNWWLVMYSWIYLFLNLVWQCPLLLLPNWLAVAPVKYRLNIL